MQFVVHPFNRFKNISFNGVEKGIEQEGTNFRLHNNHFENLAFENIIIGVDFITNTKAEDNVFENLVIQTKSYSKNLVKNITGRHNSFSSLNHSDWNAGHTNRNKLICLINISSNAEHTIIHNSETGNQGWSATNPDVNTIPNLAYLTNNGKYTQLINNFGGNSDVIYKFGNEKNTAKTTAISFTEILGQIKIAGDNATNTPTVSSGRTLITDANGFAVWSDILSATNTNWDQSAMKNISLNGWALTQSSNTPTNSVLGLRMDNNGSVRLGSTAPNTNDGLLQVDGNFVSKYNNLPQFTARNGKVFIGNANNSLFTGASAITELAFKMYVNGKIRVKDEFYIKNQGITWPDYVFDEQYTLMPLNELKNHIQKQGHLPNMPKAKWIEEQGIPVAEIVSKQQEKIEELSLYLIAMKKELDTLKKVH